MGLFLFNESIVFGYEMSVNESNLVYMLDGSTCHGGDDGDGKEVGEISSK